MPLEEVEQLLHEPYHEYRSAALQIMVTRFKPKRSTERQAIVDMYLRNLDYVNNWDLVDLSAHKILGPWLQDKDRSILYELARSKNIWHQRVAMVTTLHFIRSLDFEDTFKLAEILLHTPDDIIQKAVGWMLKEISKKDLSALLPFLDKYYREMPRTMLRYAIEKFEPELRKHYMKKINT
jgi:3-methyladenine DNA glycosylase AlkD